MSREAMEMALEWINSQQAVSLFNSTKITKALRAALAQPEPVAWRYELKAGEYVYASERHFDERYSPRPTPLYTAPPQRKPLSDEEIVRIADFRCGGTKTYEEWVQSFARSIEAAHGITGDA